MECCFGKSNKFVRNQMKDEYNNRKVNMSIIGNYKPHQVFIGDEIRIEQITSLNSLCDCDIHISIANNPMRLIISYVDIDMGHLLVCKKLIILYILYFLKPFIFATNIFIICNISFISSSSGSIFLF